MKITPVLTLCIVCFISCKKEYCRECASPQRTTGISAKGEVAFETEYETAYTVYDKREKDIGIIESISSGKWTTTDNGYTRQHTAVMKCEQQ